MANPVRPTDVPSCENVNHQFRRFRKGLALRCRDGHADGQTTNPPCGAVLAVGDAAATPFYYANPAA